ncbi:hypothetical protein [Botrimarina sp.]|uniref:hypothetical protein n=1 Tax=Botrimarina sp. TaxID=2795802 RepID=UPI0032EBBACA
MTLTDYPPATPEAMALLAALLAERGVELRVTPGGELQLRDRRGRLTAADRAMVRHYRHALADWLAASQEPVEEPADDTAPDEPIDGPIEAPADPAAPRCDRCGAGEFREVAIHAGASVRRDCARCGRTWGFPVWYGDKE